MSQHLPIWYLDTIPTETCDKIIDEMQNLSLMPANMGIDGDSNNSEHRNTDISFAPADYWANSLFERVCHHANDICQWNYSIDGYESLQLAKYQSGQHYHWHTDFFPLSGKDKDRKITVIALLNDGFTGGNFEIRLYNDYTVPLVKGSIVAFPSMLEHRVTPVESGVRYSATMWFKGPRFV